MAGNMLLGARRLAVIALAAASLAGCATISREDAIVMPLEQRVSKIKDYSWEKGDFQYDYKAELATIVEMADKYNAQCLPNQKDTSSVNILYPGSGYDLKPLALGLRILQESNAQSVNLVYTEIGNLEDREPKWNWHKGYKQLTGMLVDGFKEYIKTGLLQNMQTKQGDVKWAKAKGVEYPMTEVIYSFDVPTQQGLKRMTLTLSYNMSTERQELTDEEKAFFTENDAAFKNGEWKTPFAEEIRTRYWPQPEKQAYYRYPMYATDDQFKNADIVLCHQPGDFDLLHFDYARALLHSTPRRQSTMFTEMLERAYVHDNILPGYRRKVIVLDHSNFGLNMKMKIPQKAGAVVLVPE